MPVPEDRWRDGIFNCCRFGPIHYTLLNGCFCTPVAAGQVLNRLQSARSSTTRQQAGPFLQILALVVGFFVTRIVLFIAIAIMDPNVHEEHPQHYVDPPHLYHFLAVFDSWIGYVYMAFTTILLVMVRRLVRHKYHIPAGPCDDCCLSFFCPCLVASQMLRHTADYGTYHGRCCTGTGLEASSPPLA